VNDQNHDELMAANRHKVMPQCVWRATGVIRAVIPAEYPAPYHNPFLEMLYEDGWGRPFWGPLPRLILPPDPEPPKRGWLRRLLPR
jgi:hypothetical protein